MGYILIVCPAARAPACKLQGGLLRLALQHRNRVRSGEAVPGARRVNHLFQPTVVNLVMGQRSNASHMSHNIEPSLLQRRLQVAAATTGDQRHLQSHPSWSA